MSKTAILRAAAGGKNVEVNKFAMGLMGLTWRDEPVPDEQAFEAIRTGLETNSGVTVLNSATFYGPKSNPLANMQLIGRFFKAHPQLRDRAFIAVKGGMKLKNGYPAPDASEEHLSENIAFINKQLDGAKLDCFVMGRVDQEIPIETAVGTMKKMAEKGLCTHIAVSEASADTIRRASKVIDLAFHEFEWSPISDAIAELGIADACAENNIPILAYSPTGRGLLTGAIKKKSDIPAGDIRHGYARFSDENFPKNTELYKEFEAIAKRKNCSPAQLSLAWVAAQKGQVIPLTGSSRAAGVKENLEASKVTLSKQDLEDMQKAIAAASPSGDRAGDAGRATMAASTPALKK